MSVFAGPNIKSDTIKLLLDPSNIKSITSENLLSYSEDFSQASWPKDSEVGFVFGSDLSPDGSYNATKMFLKNSYNGSIPIYSSISGSANARYTFSVYLKYAGMRYAYLWLDNGGGFGFTLEVDLLSGVTRQTRSTNNTYFTSLTTSSTSIGNGWYRVSVSAIATSLGASYIQTRIYMGNIAWVSGNFGTPSQFYQDGVSGIYIWGYQAEQSESPTPYVKTSGAPIYRQAVDLSANNNNGSISNGSFIDYTNNSSYYFDGVNDIVTVNTTNGFGTANLEINISLSIWCKITSNGAFDHLAGFRNEGQSWGNLYMLILDGGGNAMEARIASSELSNRQLGSSVSAYYGVWTHYAITAYQNTFKWYVNGALQQTDTGLSGTRFGAISPNFSLGRTTSGSFPALGNIGNVRFYSSALSDSEIANIYTAERVRYGV